MVMVLTSVQVWAADPTATNYTRTQCQGTSMPYPTDIKPRAYPDTLTPVMINHVGRHGARFPSSSRYVNALLRSLTQADSMGSLTPTGKKLMRLCRQVQSKAANQWGALDSLGMAEERAIASRMFLTFKPLFSSTNPFISAFSSYSPRCIMSMDVFTHQLSRLSNRLEISANSGRRYSPLLRFFDENEPYKQYIQADEWKNTYDTFLDQTVPAKAIADKILGQRYELDHGEALDLARNIYKVISGCSAMGLPSDSKQYLTEAEYNALWACDNLHHYLTYSASTLSLEPAYMAAPLLTNLIETTDSAVANPEKSPAAILRFGHAETLMPLLALMHLPGCYYMTNYFDTVGLHWRDYYIVPMGANLQIILFKSDRGNYYVRTDLNEVPVPLIPGRTTLYTPWEAAKEYLQRCLPLYLQD